MRAVPDKLSQYTVQRASVCTTSLELLACAPTVFWWHWGRTRQSVSGDIRAFSFMRRMSSVVVVYVHQSAGRCWPTCTRYDESRPVQEQQLARTMADGCSGLHGKRESSVLQLQAIPPPREGILTPAAKSLRCTVACSDFLMKSLRTWPHGVARDEYDESLECLVVPAS